LRTALPRLIPLAFLLVLSCAKSDDQGVAFWHAMGGPLGDVLNGIIDEHNVGRDSLPIVSVKMGNYSTLSQKLMGAVAADRPPVLAQVYESWTSELSDAGKIVPVEDYSETRLDSATLADIWPVFLEGNRFDGELLTFPFNKSVPVFYYNMDLFDERGIDRFPGTWDEFREICGELTFDRDGDGQIDVYGSAMTINVWMFATILYQKGGRLIEGDRPAFESKEGIEALQFIKDLIYRDSVAYITTGYKHQDDFATGRVGMVWGTIVSYSFMKDKIDFRLGVAPVPVDRDSVVILSGTNVAMFSGVPEEKRERAFDFVKFFLRPENQSIWSRGTGYLPLRRSVLERPEMQAFFDQVPGMEEAVRQVERGDFEPRDPAWFTGRRYLSTEGIEPALRDVLPVKDALARAASLIETELERRRD
jgi:ABC-type glycerol-3-phosphate transport system substrate-binding protein